MLINSETFSTDFITQDSTVPKILKFRSLNISRTNFEFRISKCVSYQFMFMRCRRFKWSRFSERKFQFHG